MYLGLVISGALTFFYPSDLVDNQVGGVVVALWSASMVISALLCLVGSILDKWLGEYSGIPLLASVLGLYALSAILGAGVGSFTLLAYGLVVLSFVLGLVARWKDVRAVKRTSEDESHPSEE